MENKQQIIKSGVIVYNLFMVLAAIVFVIFTLSVTIYWAIVLGVLIASVVLLFAFLMWYGARRAAIGYCLVWTVVMIVASDVSLRYREGIWTGFRFDSELGWYPIANQRDVSMESRGGTYRVSTDTLGHRNEIAYPRDRRLPVVLQGDSNAFGFGLELDDTFCAVFTRASGEACFNLGVPGYDAQHYYFQFEAITRRFAARTRIILFNVGNDFTLSALESPYLIPRPYLFREGRVTNTVTELSSPFKKQVYGHHFIPPYAEFDDGMDTVSLGRDWGRSVPEWMEELRLPTFAIELFYPRIVKLYYRFFDKERIATGKRLNPYYPRWLLLRPEYWPEPFNHYRADFEALFSAIAAQPHDRLVIVMLPMRTQVLTSDDTLTDMFARDGHGPKHIDRSALNRFVSELGSRLGVTVVDSLETFRAHENPRSLFQADHHLSPVGMRLVVETVLREIS